MMMMMMMIMIMLIIMIMSMIMIIMMMKGNSERRGLHFYTVDLTRPWVKGPTMRWGGVAILKKNCLNTR